MVKTQHINGINIDIDKDVSCVSSECGIDNFGQRITDSFHLETVESQVTFDVIWSPKSTEKKVLEIILEFQVPVTLSS